MSTSLFPNKVEELDLSHVNVIHNVLVIQFPRFSVEAHFLESSAYSTQSI